jgi:hypothetical protein
MTMKCSHGLPYEVKCSMCFSEAMKRVSFSGSVVKVAKKEPEAGGGLFLLGDIQKGVDTDPRHL